MVDTVGEPLHDTEALHKYNGDTKIKILAAMGAVFRHYGLSDGELGGEIEALQFLFYLDPEQDELDAIFGTLNEELDLDNRNLLIFLDCLLSALAERSEDVGYLRGELEVYILPDDDDVDGIDALLFEHPLAALRIKLYIIRAATLLLQKILKRNGEERSLQDITINALRSAAANFILNMSFFTEKLPRELWDALSEEEKTMIRKLVAKRANPGASIAESRLFIQSLLAGQEGVPDDTVIGPSLPDEDAGELERSSQEGAETATDDDVEGNIVLGEGEEIAVEYASLVSAVLNKAETLASLLFRVDANGELDVIDADDPGVLEAVLDARR